MHIQGIYALSDLLSRWAVIMEMLIVEVEMDAQHHTILCFPHVRSEGKWIEDYTCDIRVELVIGVVL